MNQNHIVCSSCLSSPTYAFLSRTQCCRAYICSHCKSTHSCGKPSAPDVSNNCTCCEMRPIKIRCPECCNASLCFQCDQNIHSQGKFLLHDRQRDIPLQKCENKTLSKLLEPTVPGQLSKASSNSLFKSAMTTISINQYWEKTISELRAKFLELRNTLQDKEEELISKIQKKKEKQLRSYQELLQQYTEARRPGMNRSQHIEKIEALRAKIQAYEEGAVNPGSSKASNYNIVTSHFDVIQAQIEKMEINSLFVKISKKADMTSSNKRSLMIFGSPTPSQSTSYLKTPKNAAKHKLSISAIKTEETQEKLNEQDDGGKKEGTKMKNGQYSISVSTANKLWKVKSEKIIYKSPTNLKQYFNSKVNSNKKDCL